MTLLFVLPIFAFASFAQRQPVLKQIDLPHPYYYREMYLPQLTTGPSAAAWSPDSRKLVYSMAGSLWRQELASGTAEQLTAGPGYDYQPDWSPDGRWIVFVRYDHDAVELWSLDLRDGQARPLTSGGAVNVEPRFSPEGKRLAFVSTSFKGHFHIFVGRFEDGVLSDVRQLTPENVSTLPRYYYSKVDHEISPAWSRDGTEILFVSNRGHIYGTGGFWRMKAEPGAEPREIRYEETNWKARTDFSPDGKRLVYASYLGRAWHQLWVMPAEGGDAFPISYGEFDNTNPRWSPDGARIAFISNRGGNTSLWVQSIPGGDQTEVKARERKYLKPMGKLSLRVVDSGEKPVAARVFLTAADGRAYAPDDAWMQADDSYDRSERPFEAHYFDTMGTSEITVPAGLAQVDVMRGFEYAFQQERVEIKAGATSHLTVKMRLIMPYEPAEWVSGDAHVHMNYGGAYRNTPAHLVQQAAAENLSIIENLLVNKEQRVPDVERFMPHPDPESTGQQLLLHGQEFHTSYWGHLGLLNLTQNFLLPGYAAYPGTAAASLYPANANVADMAHAQGALVGYVHPFDTMPDPVADESLTDELPVDVALGKVDYIEVLGFSDHKATAEVWYKLLNCGFRLPTAAGTDFMADYASVRGPIGLNRVYAEVKPGPLTIKPWLEAIKAGRTFATNGPLLSFELGGKSPGGEIHLAARRESRNSQAAIGRDSYQGMPSQAAEKAWFGVAQRFSAAIATFYSLAASAAEVTDSTFFAAFSGMPKLRKNQSAFRRWVPEADSQHGTSDRKQEVPYKVSLRSIVPVDHLQIVCNGKVAREIEMPGDHKTADATGKLTLPTSGWCVLRAFSDRAEYPILDLYPYATTSPVYVTVPGAPLKSPADAAYFMTWIDRLIAAARSDTSWNTDAEKQSVLALLEEARKKYEALAQ